MELSLTQELDKIRASNRPVDVSRGMALIYKVSAHNGNGGQPGGTACAAQAPPTAIGLFTVAFAESWCKDDPDYRWERV